MDLEAIIVTDKKCINISHLEGSYFEKLVSSQVGQDSSSCELTVPEFVVVMLQHLTPEVVLTLNDRTNIINYLEYVSAQLRLSTLLLKGRIPTAEFITILKNVSEKSRFVLFRQFLEHVDLDHDEMLNFAGQNDAMMGLYTDMCISTHVYTPLMLVCSKKFIYEDFENITLSWRPDHVNDKGSTALMYACRKRLSRVALYLINRFGDSCLPAQYNKNGHTALTLACYSGLSDVALRLIQRFGESCLPSQVSDSGNTALMYACQRRLSSVALMLIDKFGVSCLPEQINKFGHTALNYASRANIGGDVVSLLTDFSKS